MPREDYAAYNEMRTKEDGWFWFIEYTTRGRAAMIRKDGWKYCRYVGDLEEVYNLEEDPMEQRNLANEPGFAQQKDRLKGQLLDWLLMLPLQ